jgi:dTMP kinase
VSADAAPFVPQADGGMRRLPPAPWRVFGSSHYFRLWIAQVLSSLGDWIGLVAVISLAQRVSGSTAAVGLVMVARMLPGFFLAPLGGVLVDRWDRRRVMVACDIGRAAILVYLPFLKTVPGLFFASFLIEVLTLLWSPAKDASVPNLVPPEKLTTANSLSLVAAYGTFPIGSLLFALLAKLPTVLHHSETLPLWADGLSFLSSGLLVSTLALGHGDRRHQKVDWRATWRDLSDGLRFIGSHELVRGVMTGLGAGLLGGGAVIPLGPAVAKDVLGAGSSGFGLLMTFLGTGTAVGVLALSPVQRRLKREALFAGAVIGSGISIVFAASMSTLLPAALLVGLLGLCAGSAYVTGFTVLQENVSDELRGRTFATLYTVIRLCLLLSLAVTPIAAGALDGLSGRLFDHKRLTFGGSHIALPGVRLALWLGGFIVIVAGFLAALEVRRARARAEP